ncbi:MAG: hypothetical protein ACREMY_26395 [bacterium]
MNVQPQLQPGLPVIGWHWQNVTREALFFTGQAWWREQTVCRWVEVSKSGTGGIILVVIAGFFFWPLWLVLIAMIGTKVVPQWVPTGEWVPVAVASPEQAQLALPA